MPALTIEDRYNRLAEKRRINNVQHMRSPLAVPADERTDDELITLAQQEHAAFAEWEVSPAGRLTYAIADARKRWQDVNAHMGRLTSLGGQPATNRQAILDAIHGAEMEMLKVTDTLQRAVAALDEVA